MSISIKKYNGELMVGTANTNGSILLEQIVEDIDYHVDLTLNKLSSRRVRQAISR